ncbi:bifunctional 3-(3-hydroxy-phenyl)propionate/3-hydroxycinnamic acid hydroxylase [Phaeobacter gallaeciensis]|uniref:bifunctional 3-(3-hydroxy-phenyl)propionate/3-hydroxycinnamic acid hydroxylase n=1 Tax=Phaeobacter gallaeciensis TaxID=60890 RepID=UPI000BBBBAB1|nr:bifunctional 3-(3-hydroxy-phenyl)propionate/3-hydroxycinnamic acid hydroxylase [Phaeobacter gallaeciensis]ATF20607.1 2-polyprenyl-6-methoxyphenol hydroxylase [Phaeobacter gallaeciensis]ATF24716.1 2-polyprenyl-6-methoxyphenol hydroxylase [Phaeobacter gallaeciensis]
MQGTALDTDILVIGAGPTGLLLTNLLGSMGIKTILIERNETTVQEPRAVSIDDESMRALQAAGLPDEVATITAKGYGSLYRGPSGRQFAEVKPFVKEYGFDKRNAFEQPEFEAVMRKALGRHASVEARFGITLDGFEQGEDRVTAEVTGPDGPQAVTARYMVAADGGRSQARKALEIQLEGSTFEEPWLIVDLETTKNRCFHTEVFCAPKRSAITLPGPGGIRRYEFKLNPGETLEEAEEEAFGRKLLAETGPDENEPIRRQKVYTFHARIASKWRVGRVFLAGDAAHLTPPFAGQGMNSGLRDAHNLAWKLAEALDMANPEALLDSYEKERKPHAWSMIELALKMGKVMMPDSALRGFMTRTGFRLLGLYGPARDYVAQMKYKPKPKFSDGMIRPVASGAGAGAVGRMIPQPLVNTLSREERLLDSCLPDRPVVLLFDEAPDSAMDAALIEQVRSTGAEVIGLTPEWTNPVAATFPILRDRSRFFSQQPFRDCLGHALLLRRDRYVAAIEPVGNIAGLLPVIQSLTAGATQN